VSVTKLLLRPDEVAEQLSISRSKVYELVKDGKLQAWRPNGPKKKPIRITAASLADFYQTQLVGILSGTTE
jgi:excisionase family DNA binding protein